MGSHGASQSGAFDHGGSRGAKTCSNRLQSNGIFSKYELREGIRAPIVGRSMETREPRFTADPRYLGEEGAYRGGPGHCWRRRRCWW